MGKSCLARQSVSNEPVSHITPSRIRPQTPMAPGPVFSSILLDDYDLSHRHSFRLLSKPTVDRAEPAHSPQPTQTERYRPHEREWRRPSAAESTCALPLDIDLPGLALYARDFDSGLPSPTPEYPKKGGLTHPPRSTATWLQTSRYEFGAATGHSWHHGDQQPH
jgi:hypothetical protein